MGKATRGVVLGGSLAGFLAASVLARHLDSVTIIDRDELPDGPYPRKGVPQARHVHQLWSSGAHLFDELLPGTTDRLFAAGAYRIGIPGQHVTLSAYGWQHRFPDSQFMVCCSRPLIDWTVRQQVLRDERITVADRTEACALLGTADRVTGVRLRSLDRGEVWDLIADLVVDASGRGSAIQNWLADLGIHDIQQDIIDCGIVYATRLYAAPVEVAGFPLVSVYGDHRAQQPGQNALLFPVEGNRWLVTLSGTRGGEPSGAEDAFLEFARGLRHPIIADLLAMAEPLSPVRRTRTTTNRRNYYDRLTQWPDGLVVTGDAMAAFNPFYGHGMVSAARCAVEIDAQLSGSGLADGMAFRAIQRIAAAIDQPWSLATSQDICYPGCRSVTSDPRLTRHAGKRQEFSDRAGELAMRHPVVSAAVLQIASLSGPETCLEDPEVGAALQSGPSQPALQEPPFTDMELAAIDRARRSRAAGIAAEQTASR